MTRARLLAAVVAVTVVCSGESVFRAQSVTYDVVIRGGHIVDGNGNPWFAGDVGIRNGRVAAIGKLDNAPATRVIDAAGRIVAPGFIDLHTHSDLSVLADPLSQSKVRQGVTLDVLGESTRARSSRWRRLSRRTAATTRHTSAAKASSRRRSWRSRSASPRRRSCRFTSSISRFAAATIGAPSAST